MTFHVDKTKREAADAICDTLADALGEHGIAGVPLERVQDRVLEAIGLDRPEPLVEEPEQPDEEGS